MLMLATKFTPYRPLTLNRFGIELRRMTEADKETVRLGRNKDFVRFNHVYRNIITLAEQEQWFREMNSRSHYVLIIVYHGRKVGTVIIRDIPDTLEDTTCGTFIWDEDFIGTKVPILSILTALDFFFHDVGVGRTESVVLKSNTPAIKMNTFFGFEFIERDKESFLIVMHRATYLNNRDRLLQFARRAVKDRTEHKLRISGTASPLNLAAINTLLTG